jgi:hypothetical protein
MTLRGDVTAEQFRAKLLSVDEFTHQFFGGRNMETKEQALEAQRRRAHEDHGVRGPAHRFIVTYFGGCRFRAAAFFQEFADMTLPEPLTWEGDYA